MNEQVYSDIIVFKTNKFAFCRHKYIFWAMECKNTVSIYGEMVIKNAVDLLTYRKYNVNKRKNSLSQKF